MNSRLLSILVTVSLLLGTIGPAQPVVAMESGPEAAAVTDTQEETAGALPDEWADSGEVSGAVTEDQTEGAAAPEEDPAPAQEVIDLPGDEFREDAAEEDVLPGEDAEPAAEEAPEEEPVPIEDEALIDEETGEEKPETEDVDDPSEDETEAPGTTAEDELPEEDISLSVLDLPEAEIITFTDLTSYVKAVSSLTSEYDFEEDATLVIDTASRQVSTGDGEELERAGQAVMEAAELPAREAADYLRSADYAVISVKGDEVVVSDPYQTARLLVTSDTGVNTAGAVRVLHYENEYILQYATSGDAAQAYELLAGTVDCLEQDIPLDVMDDDEWIYEAEAWFDDAETAAAVRNAANGEEGMFENQEDYLSWAVPYLGIDQVLAGYNEETAQEIVVAVIDSGFDNVEGFFDSGRILEPLTVAANGDTSDANARKHGTFVLGEIYEATPANIKLLPVRAYNDENKMSMSTLMAALRLVQNYDAHVSLVNMSIGSSGDQGIAYSGAKPDAIFLEMTEAGTFFVGAAGNNSTSLAECYPAKSQYVCAVTAIDEEGYFAESFSNYGDSTYAVAYSAPGALMRGVTPLTQSHVTTMKGTSMASPYVVTCAALLMSQGKLAGLSGAAGFEAALGNYVKEGLTAGTDADYYGAGCVGFPADIGFVSLAVKNYYYNNGYEVRPGDYVTTQGLTVTAGADTLVKDVDYTVSYENNIEPGQATVSVTGIGLYGGTSVGHFNIYGKMEECEISSIGNAVYDGDAVTPEPLVTFHGRTLVKDEDYTLSYADNTMPGTASVTVQGIGFYRNSQTVTFTIRPAAPVFAMSNEKTGIRLAWNKVPGADGYIVYRREGGVEAGGTFARLKKISNPDTVSFTDKTAESGTLYTYTVRAYTGGISGVYVPAEFYRLAGVTAKAENTAAGIMISWSSVQGAGGYYVYRRKTTESGYTQIGKTGRSRLSFVDKSAVNGGKYRYFVRPFYGSYSAHFLSSTLFTRLSPVAISSASSSTAGKVLVKWKKNAKATGYQVRYAYNSAFSDASTVKVTGKDALSRTLSGLASGKKVYIKVRTYRNVDGKNYYSAWSAATAVRVK